MFWEQTTKYSRLYFTNTEEKKRLSVETKLAFAQYGRCASCRGPISPETLCCSQCPESKRGHEYIWFPPNASEIIESGISREQQRDRNRERIGRRNAAMRQVLGFHTDQDIVDMRHAQKDACYYCGDSLNDKDARYSFVRDHMAPVACGGSEWPSNIALTCIECNKKKSYFGQEAFWNYLRRIHGAKWVARRKNANKEVIVLRQKLTNQRRAELARLCRELESRVSDAIDQHKNTNKISLPEYATVTVSNSKVGVTIEYGDTLVAFSPSSHRRIKKWVRSDASKIADLIIGLENLMGNVKPNTEAELHKPISE